MESDGAELISDNSSSDVEDIQPRSQGSLLLAVGQVGENPWNEVGGYWHWNNQGTKFGT